MPLSPRQKLGNIGGATTMQARTLPLDHTKLVDALFS